MKITKVSVEDLFYSYSYSIDFKTDTPVSIIHAPNGYGKTTIFTLIRDVLDLNIKGLYKIPFKSFSIHLSDSTSINVVKNEEKDDNGCRYTFPVEITVSQGKNRPQKLILNRNKLPYYMEDIRPPYQLERFINEIIKENRKFIDEFIKIRKNIEIHFIETNRLYVQSSFDSIFSFLESEKRNSYPRNDTSRRNPHASIEANERIRQCAVNLRNLINSVKQLYSTTSEEIDRSFPNRLVAAVKEKCEHFSEEEIKSKLVELDAKRKELKITGFISGEQNEPLLSISDFDETLMIFYTLYIKDTFRKLSHYDDIKKKIELFLRIINERTPFSNKEMSIISSEGRVCFKPKGASTKSTNEIELEELSSGEKHDFILFYELIFNSDEKSVFLIDEPEISLHVAWQVEYVKIIEDICGMNNMQIIIATHSPDIVNDREDLLIGLELEEKENGK